MYVCVHAFTDLCVLCYIILATPESGEATPWMPPPHLSDLPFCPLSLGLYYVDSEGNRVCGDLFAVGSGSMYAYGVMDSGLQHSLSVEEACELGRRAIYQATYRDAYSGGQVNLYHVHSKGWTRVSQTDVLTLHQQYKEEA